MDAVATKAGGGAAAPARTSAIIAALAEAPAPDGRVSFGAVVAALGDRAYGALLVLLAAPSILPTSHIPGLQLVFAVPLVLIGGQLALGFERPRFPGFVERWRIPAERLRAVLRRIAPVLARIERYVRPRAAALVSPLAERLMGIAGIVLAVILALPIPFGNLLPALGLLAFGLALVEKDGRMAAAGFVVFGASLAAVAVLAVVAVEILRAALAWFGL